MERKLNLLALTPLAFALVCTPALAASRVDLHKQDAKRLEMQYKAATIRAGAAANAADRHADMLARGDCRLRHGVRIFE